MTNNVPALVTTAVQELPQETFNNVFLQMLTGVKDASGEIYTASKEMISSAISFSMEQAPQVVHEFILWAIVKNSIAVFIFFLVLGFFLYFNNKMFKYCSKEAENTSDPLCYWLPYAIVTAISIAIFIAIFCNIIYPSMLDGVKAAIAPRIYLMEWAVQQFNSIKK